MSARRLDIGIASYGSPERLARTLASIRDMAITDFRVLVIDNPCEAVHVRPMVEALAKADPRFVLVPLDSNLGYAGAVNEFLRRAETEYLAYCDNDIEILTRGWDETLCSYLDRFHEIGVIFPNGGTYPIARPGYQEVQWGVGFCWVLSRMTMRAIGKFDATLGHQEEADYCLRVRMAGWRCAAAPEIQVRHDAAATNDPAAIERISAGVVRFVDKWCRYFGGADLNYYSQNVLRWEDWPPNALYMEEYWRLRVAGLNAEPEVVNLDGREYDLIRVPRLKAFYRGRII